MLFTNPKNNLREKKPTLAYRIISAEGGFDIRTSIVIKTSKIQWEEVVDISADQAIAGAIGSKKDYSGARLFLMDMLANGPVRVKLIEERAAIRKISYDQLRRAREKMGIIPFKEKGKDGVWFGALPQHAPTEN
jgi:hypothetical protein